MDRKTIDKLKEIAKKVAKSFRHAPSSGSHTDNDFSRVADTEPTFEIKGKTVVFKFHQYAVITFSNVRPMDVLAIRPEPATTVNETIEAVNSIKVYNDTDTDVSRDYSFTKTHVSTRQKEVSRAIEIEINRSFSFGVKLKVIDLGGKIDQNIKYTNSWKNLSRETDETSAKDSVSFTVPARTNYDITVQRSTADYRQKIEMDVLLDFKMQVDSRDDWNPVFDNVDDYYAYVNGVSGIDHFLAKWFFENPVDIRFTDEDLSTTLTSDIRFSNATTGSVIVTKVG